jgi:hypothetical protein
VAAYLRSEVERKNKVLEQHRWELPSDDLLGEPLKGGASLGRWELAEGCFTPNEQEWKSLVMESVRQLFGEIAEIEACLYEGVELDGKELVAGAIEQAGMNAQQPSSRAVVSRIMAPLLVDSAKINEAATDLDGLIARCLRPLEKRVVAKIDSEDESPSDIVKLSWNCDTGILTFNGSTIREVKNRGPKSNIVQILAAFEEEKWPRRIDDPLSQGKLRESIRSLNTGIADSTIRFVADGTGEGIRWETAD